MSNEDDSSIKEALEKRQKEKAGVVLIFLATILMLGITALRIWYPDQYDAKELLVVLSSYSAGFIIMGIKMIPNKPKC